MIPGNQMATTRLPPGLPLGRPLAERTSFHGDSIFPVKRIGLATHRSPRATKDPVEESAAPAFVPRRGSK
jgi:hypothetical protein